MPGALKETAEKKLKSRIRKFKKVNKSDEEKDKFFEQLGGSVEIYLPSKNPEEISDSILFYTTADGKIIEAEYSYNEGDNFETIPLDGKNLDIVVEAFSSNFHLEFLDNES